MITTLTFYPTQCMVCRILVDLSLKKYTTFPFIDLPGLKASLKSLEKKKIIKYKEKMGRLLVKSPKK